MPSSYTISDLEWMYYSGDPTVTNDDAKYQYFLNAYLGGVRASDVLNIAQGVLPVGSVGTAELAPLSGKAVLGKMSSGTGSVQEVPWATLISNIAADLTPVGVGIPPGGTTDQVLGKINGTDYNVSWRTPTGGGGSVTPPVEFASTAVGMVPLVLKGFSGQTANLQEWQNSAGTVLTRIHPEGYLSWGNTQALPTWKIDASTSTFKITGNDGAGQDRTFWSFTKSGTGLSAMDFYISSSNYYTFSPDGSIPGYFRFQSSSGTIGYRFDAGAANRTPLTVKGAASQTANLQEWQDSGGTPQAVLTAGGVLSSHGFRLYSAGDYYGSPSGADQLFYGGSSPNSQFTARAASHVPLVLKGFASQSANLQEWQDSTGFVRASIGPYGAALLERVTLSGPGSYLTSLNGKTALALENASPNNLMTAGAAAHVALVVKGAALQSANLFEVQDSTGAVKFALDSSGNVARVVSGLDIYNTSGGNSAAHLFFDNFNFMSDSSVGGRNFGTGEAQLYVKDGNAGRVGMYVRGAASQSANLQEWQDSAASVIAKVNSNGTIYGASFVPTTASARFYDNALNSFALLTATSPNTYLQAAAAAHIPLVVKGFASQSANLQEWQDSAGALKAYVDPGGYVRAISFQALTGGAFYGDAHSSRADSGPRIVTNGSTVQVENRTTASLVPLTVKGMASQTANLQEWQDSAGTVQTKVVSGGGIAFVSAFGNLASSDGTSYVMYGGSPNNLMKAGAAAHIPLVVKGFASQSANLQEWQNSSGTVLASVLPTGAIVAPNGAIGTPGLRFVGATDWGFYKESNGIWAGINGSYIARFGAAQVFLQDGVNLEAGTTTGSKIGAATTQKFGFWNATPVVQPAVTVPINTLLETTGLQAVHAITDPSIIIKGMASQTADLQHWQDSGGTVKSSINSAGIFVPGAGNLGAQQAALKVNLYSFSSSVTDRNTSTAEENLISFTLGANDMATDGDVMIFESSGDLTCGSTGTWTWRFKVGAGTGLVTPSDSITNDANLRRWTMRCSVRRLTSTTMSISATLLVGLATAALKWTKLDTNLCYSGDQSATACDFTTAQTVAFTVQMSVSNANNRVRQDGYSARLLRA